MSKSKTFDRGSLIVGLGYTIFFLFTMLFIRTNHHFQIGNDDKVHLSPAMAQAAVPGLVKFLSWAMVVVMWVVIVMGGNGVFETKSGANGKGLAILGASLLLCLIFTLGWYSGKTDNNYVQITEQQKIDWATSGAIKKTGENSYKDNTGVLKVLFANKEIK